MKEKVYVFGHRNPDTDSICSAIAYAHLKSLTDDRYDFEAAALGTPSNETRFVLDTIGMDAPKIIDHLRPKVTDITLGSAQIVHENSSIKETLEKVVAQDGRSLPVVGKYNHLIGVVSISDLLPMYMNKDQQDFLSSTETPFSNLIGAMPVDLCAGTMPVGIIKGRLILFDDLHDDEELTQDDIIFCNVKTYESGVLDTYNAGTIIMGNLIKERVLLKPNERRTLFTTRSSVYALIRLIHKTVPIQSIVSKTNLEYFSTYETLEDVKKNMATSKYRRFPVVDENGCVVGMISRSSLLSTNNKKAILVDHNEKSQSIDGVEDVKILEVIDHHRVADIQTMGPLYFRVEPVGCTSTIVAKMYEENDVEISKKMAQVMLSAILSDTLIFKSPTSTKQDEFIAKKLAKIAELNIQDYGLSMIYASSDLENATPLSVLTTDMKRFMFGNKKVMIAQTNTSDFDNFFSMYKEVEEEMTHQLELEKADLFVLLVTDVIVGGTELVAQGESKWIADQAFKIAPNENSVFLPGVFSRKKQVVPKLMQAARL